MTSPLCKLWSFVVRPLLVASGVAGVVWMVRSTDWIFGNALAAIGLCGIALLAPLRGKQTGATKSQNVQQEKKLAPRPAAKHSSADGSQSSLIDEMLWQGRFALLLRPQIADNLTRQQHQEATRLLDESMCVVPEGDVILHSQFADDDERSRGRVVRVEAFYLDRHCVTNRQFAQFVAGGGYEDLSLWDEAALPAVLDFVDQTGQPGPQFWSHGTFVQELADHPVVGVSWYEAAAFARWLGKRLPSDPQWVKAAAWPVASSDGTPLQRRFPWGDSMDRDRCNLWGHGHNGTAAVTEFSSAATVGGVHQMVGNVWEWTSCDLAAWEEDRRWLCLPEPMKSLRGGAFDTYFDCQAACQFQSGDGLLARKHNIGFRCALSMSDLAATDSPHEDYHQPPEAAS